jgi:phage repressor protein C with HTH and peptisase S24 domain
MKNKLQIAESDQNIDKKDFAARLNQALDKEGFPPKNKGRIQLLAEMVGLTHRGASKWINGETCPPAKKYIILAEKLNVNPEWLKTGKGAMSQESNNSPTTFGLQTANAIPVFKLEDINKLNKNPIQTVNCNLPTQGNALGIMLESEAMSPRFPSNSIIILDSKKTPKDGDFVLVKSNDYPVPIFRQLLVMGSVNYLQAHNPKFDRLQLSPTDEIIGVMIQAILSFI